VYRTSPIVGFVLVAVGAIWIGQGLGVIRGGSFMVDDIRWAVAGVALALIGLVLLVRAMRARTR
jgi:hypothetical protein